MRVALIVFVVFAVLFVGGLRLAVLLSPSDPEKWHVPPGLPGSGEAVETAPGGHAVAVVLPGPPQEVLARLDAIAMDTPRTERLAGSVDDGMITYVTRTLFWGFPDYTTVRAEPHPDGTRLSIRARLRFGQGDMGVNRARVEDWLAQLGVDAPA